MNYRLGKIKSIDIGTDEKGLEGYEVITDKVIVRVFIDMTEEPCEYPGYFATNDNLNDFIGAELNDIYIADRALKTKEVEHTYQGETVFVNFDTSKGTLQLGVYNEGNGYYGHQAKVTINKKVVFDDYICGM